MMMMMMMMMMMIMMMMMMMMMMKMTMMKMTMMIESFKKHLKEIFILIPINQPSYFQSTIAPNSELFNNLKATPI